MNTNFVRHGTWILLLFVLYGSAWNKNITDLLFGYIDSIDKLQIWSGLVNEIK